MKRILKSTILGLAVAATTMTTLPAQADHWRRHHHRHIDNDDALAAGLAGLAIGAIVGGVLTQPRYPSRVYIDPPVYAPPHYTYRPAPVYRKKVRYYHGGFEPWTRDWYRACDVRYRRFDPSSGTFMGYDGRRHFCVIR